MAAMAEQNRHRPVARKRDVADAARNRRSHWVAAERPFAPKINAQLICHRTFGRLPARRAAGQDKSVRDQNYYPHRKIARSERLMSIFGSTRPFSF
jgi:hypothetical protein